MNNILCKIGLHKWRKVKSTKTNVLEIMKNILKAMDEPFRCISEESICEKFGVDSRNGLLFGYEVYDEVCIRPGCGRCKYNINEKITAFTKARVFLVKIGINNKDKDKTIENIYKRCKNEC